MKRFPIIRHVRFFYLRWRLERWVDYCRDVGVGVFAQESDWTYLQEVWEGKR